MRGTQFLKRILKNQPNKQKIDGEYKSLREEQHRKPTPEARKHMASFEAKKVGNSKHPCLTLVLMSNASYSHPPCMSRAICLSEYSKLFCGPNTRVVSIMLNMSVNPTLEAMGARFNEFNMIYLNYQEETQLQTK